MGKVVIFNGSPRKDGNINTMLDTIARGVREAGGQAKYYNLFQMKFMACQSCFACRVKGECIVQDQMHEAIEEIKNADAVVIGSPIYMMQMSGLVKNLYDRLYPLMSLNGMPRGEAKPFVAVYSQGSEDPETYQSYFDYTAAMYPAYGFDLVDTIVATNGTDPESADKDKELKIRCYEIGRSFVANQVGVASS